MLRAVVILSEMKIHSKKNLDINTIQAKLIFQIDGLWNVLAGNYWRCKANIRAALLSNKLFSFVFPHLIYALVYDTKSKEMLQNSKHMTCSHEFVLLPKRFLSKSARHLLIHRPNFLQDNFSGIHYSPILNFSVLVHYWEILRMQTFIFFSSKRKAI